MISKLALLGPCLLLATSDGCPPATKSVQVPLEPSSSLTQAEQNTRFRISIEARFKDDLAYDGERGIYLLRDLQTGAEYVGVSGIGISEVGSHTEPDGKRSESVQDER